MVDISDLQQRQEDLSDIESAAQSLGHRNMILEE